MNYFFDTEFIETNESVHLLSIGIVCEDGRTFYAENTAVDKRLADEWVTENVVNKLNAFKLHNSHKLTSFINIEKTYLEVKGDYNYIKQQLVLWLDEDPTFYAYYASYDWVCFCKLFGRMIDVPKKYKWYSRDLKQMLDEKVESLESNDQFHYKISHCTTLEEKLNVIKELNDYPTQDNAHNALDDAQWNQKLYKFIQEL